MYVKQAGEQDRTYFAHTDHLGSIVKLTDNNGNPLFQASYDAWGLQTLSGSNTFAFHRGYIGHEHLPEFGLINMTRPEGEHGAHSGITPGRMYHPVLGRFLSPDPFVQAPEYSQNFNRYSYCLNNPLVYTDPSGEFIFTILAGIFAQPLLPFAFSIDMGWMTGGLNSKMNGGTFWEGAWKGGLMGAASGVTSFVGIPGIIPNGLLQSGVNVGTNGLINLLSGDPYFKNWGGSAISGLISGSFTGYRLSKQGGLNYWWGTEKGKWAYNRNQWSLGWWDKASVIEFNSNSFNGPAISCDAATMATIDSRYTPEQWNNIIKGYTSTNEMGELTVNYNQMYKDYGVHFFNTSNINMTGAEIQGFVNKGYSNLSLTVGDYYGITGEGPANHRMTVNKIKYIPGKYMKLYVSDWGWGRIQNGIHNYNMVYRWGNTPFTPKYFTFFR